MEISCQFGVLIFRIVIIVIRISLRKILLKPVRKIEGEVTFLDFVFQNLIFYFLGSYNFNHFLIFYVFFDLVRAREFACIKIAKNDSRGIFFAIFKRHSASLF